MSETRRTGSAPIAASTVILVRDCARTGGLEVFLVERHREIEFAGGATVFPGGKVDPSDCSSTLRERCRGGEALDDDALALRVAA
ncbi:MAG TPA: NUDIX hydrolase, partial [Myxococcota bacterium]|nr:NUDIX hydrolase [Myxococcota bacterium]